MEAGARTVREGFVPFRGHRRWFRVVGPNGFTGGSPLLCLHAGPGIPHDYLEPLDAMAAERAIVFYDQLGCGHSDHHQDSSLCTIDAFVAEIDAMREYLGLHRVHLFGHSWGGMLGLEYLLTRPSGVLSFIAASTLASMPMLVSEIARLRLDLPVEPDVCLETLLVFMKKHVCRLEVWPDCLNRSLAKCGTDDFVMRTMLGPSVLQIDGTLRDWDILARLHEIDLPVLVTCGRYDETTPRIAQQIADGIPHAELRIFEHSSHTAHIEESSEYLSVLDAFLTRIDGLH